jgi:ubiquinone/menaquinone biosynthesis C-methylase UbiE
MGNSQGEYVSELATGEVQIPELPSSDLMFRVAGTPDPVWFWKSGRMSIDGINGILSHIGKSFTDFPRSLEFGCGCGRILLHLKNVAEAVDLYGVDIDAEAIGWAQQHIPWVTCSVNQGLPPLDFPDEHFDLVFNHSVFTHMDESYQDAWLVELERITKPGGVLVLSVSGEGPFADIEKSWLEAKQDPTTLRDTLRTKGCLFIKDDSWTNGPFPDFYHTMLHAPWYIFERWGSIFDIKAYIVRGDLDYQDLLLLRRRDKRVGVVDTSKSVASELAQARERVAELESSLIKSDQQGHQWRASAERSAAALKEVTAKLRQTQEQLTQLELQGHQWRATAERSAADLNNVLKSRSWRMTAPIRNVIARLRGT